MRIRKGFLASLCAAICLNHAMAGDTHTGQDKVSYGFIENKGQITDQYHKRNDAVAYLLSTPGLNIQLRKNGFSYDTYIAEYTKASEGAPGGSMANTKLHPHVTYHFQRIDITLEGSNAGCKMVAGERSRDFINYYTTGAADGILNVHHYGKVTYQNIYNGIDLEFVVRPGTNKPVEYNFIIHPGADASQIRMRYDGASPATLEDGSIKMAAVQGELTETIPASFTATAHQPVAVTYTQYNGNTFGYSIPPYDRAQTLVIDPTPDRNWATYFGGSDFDGGGSVVLAGGNLYLAGAAASTGIATVGAYQAGYAGNFDGYLVQFVALNVVGWSTYYGGSGEEDLRAVVADSATGDVYISGYTGSTSGMASPGAHQATYGGGTYDGFIAKFNSSGVRLWGTYYGGSGTERVWAAATDPNGNVYMAGYTNSISGIASNGAAQTANAGGNDGFLVKFNSSGVRQWATYAGNDYDDGAYGVATDLSGNVFLCGSASYTFAANNLVTTGAHQTSFGGGYTDHFLEKYNASGVRQWGTYYGGSGDEGGINGVATDVSGNVYLTGSTASTGNMATTGTSQPAYIGTATNSYIAKFNSNGVRQWGTYYGAASGPTNLSFIATDPSGNICVAGYTGAGSGLATTNAYQTTTNNISSFYSDACIAKFSNTGGMIWSTYYGDTKDEISYGLCVDDYGRVFAAGETNSPFGMATTGAYLQANQGSTDVFVAIFYECTAINATTSIVNACYGVPNGQVTVNATGGIPPYLYKEGIGNYQTSNTITGLLAGSHTITILDDAGCTSTVTVTVPQNAQISSPSITGKSTVQKGESVVYSTPAQTGISFNWTVSGGNITSGQGTNQVQVLWGPNGAGSVKVVANGTAPCSDSSIANIVINPATAVEDISDSRLLVYPNPSHGNFEIRGNVNTAEPVRMEVVNAIGQLVYSDEITATNGTVQKTYNLSHLQSGVYNLIIKTGGKKQNIRLLVE